MYNIRWDKGSEGDSERSLFFKEWVRSRDIFESSWERVGAYYLDDLVSLFQNWNQI